MEDKEMDLFPRKILPIVLLFGILWAIYSFLEGITVLGNIWLGSLVEGILFSFVFFAVLMNIALRQTERVSA